MHRMHSQVAHDADLSARFYLPLPVRRLGRIEIAAVRKTGVNLQHVSEISLLGNPVSPLRTG